jgi:subtilisin family serine protease
MRPLALLAFLFALAAPGSASAARFAIGVERGTDSRAVVQRIETRTGNRVSRIGPFALTVRAPSAAGLSSVNGVSWVERIRASRRLTFTPSDPHAVRQWYLSRIHAFDAWSQMPNLAGVRVAVLDSGIDSAHPDLQNRIADGRSFVARSSWENDTNGHGTFVAGEIAAATNNAQGIAGVGFPATLLVAKIVRSDGTISPDAEARAIRWAVDNGARVINLSFGGVRDPNNPDGDTYSPLEAAAVRYAVGKGVLVVAAVGNADNAPTEPWGWAGYPAALPHVLGVSAIARDGSVPTFSNRDRRHNDIAAPGEAIFSTLPRALTGAKPACFLQGYSDCGPTEFRRGEGTSFSAPQVAGAAATLFGVMPSATADQVANALTRSAADAEPDTGCIRCSTGHDALTGWGLLDVASAVRTLSDSPPEPDRYEANDEASIAAPIWGRKGQGIRATIDYWDDRVDVYKIKLRPGELVARLRGPGGANSNLFLWKPGTQRIGGKSTDRRLLAAQSKSPGSRERIRLNVTRRGWYYLVVKVSTPGEGRYTLRYRKRPRPAPPAVLP